MKKHREHKYRFNNGEKLMGTPTQSQLSTELDSKSESGQTMQKKTGTQNGNFLIGPNGENYTKREEHSSLTKWLASGLSVIGGKQAREYNLQTKKTPNTTPKQESQPAKNEELSQPEFRLP